jgi:prepilin-type processing-associated H-X9-DG protein
LIELLVVISIIALLIAILLPALSKAREAGRKVQCLSQERQMGIAFSSYAAEQRDQLPITGESGGCQWPWRLFPKTSTVAAFEQFDLFRCPSDQLKVARSYAVTSSDSSATGYKGAYVSVTDGGSSYMAGQFRLGSFTKPSEDFLVVEAVDSRVTALWHGYYATVNRNFQIKSGGPWVHVQLGSNYLYLDGHGAYLAAPTTWGTTGFSTGMAQTSTTSIWDRGFDATN